MDHAGTKNMIHIASEPIAMIILDVLLSLFFITGLPFHAGGYLGFSKKKGPVLPALVKFIWFPPNLLYWKRPVGWSLY